MNLQSLFLSLDLLHIPKMLTVNSAVVCLLGIKKASNKKKFIIEQMTVSCVILLCFAHTIAKQH